MTRKWFVLAVWLALGSTCLYAQSAKNALQLSSLKLVSGGPATSTSVASDAWQPVLGDYNIFAPNAVRIHTSQQKDLIMGASFECGVYTRTLVKSKNASKDTSSAEAGVHIRIRVDPGTPLERTAYPGDVTFCDRYQELSATLQGILDLICTDTNGDGQLDSCNLDTVDTETIELIQQTLNANAFFFALNDLGAGTHNIVVEAQITSSTDWMNGSASASALIGKGAVVVDEARLVKSGDIEE